MARIKQVDIEELERLRRKERETFLAETRAYDAWLAEYAQWEPGIATANDKLTKLRLAWDNAYSEYGNAFNAIDSFLYADGRKRKKGAG